MTFRLVRVKRRADQEPVEALYVQEGVKRAKEGTDSSTDIRIFKLVNRDAQEPQTFRKSAQDAKVVLLNEPSDMATVAEAVLCDDPSALKKMEKPSLKLDESLESLGLSEPSDLTYVYDLYRLDLGRYTESDIKGNMASIVYYEQELVNEEELTDSDFYEDFSDSNAEDYYANDYPEEESDGEFFRTSDEEWDETFHFSEHSDLLNDYNEYSDFSE